MSHHAKATKNPVYSRIAVAVIVACAAGCEFLPPSEEETLTWKLRMSQLCQGETVEDELECMISKAVDSMIDTLDPGYKSPPFFGNAHWALRK